MVLESVRLSLLLFAAPVRRFLSISTYSTAEQLKKLRHIMLLNGGCDRGAVVATESLNGEYGVSGGGEGRGCAWVGGALG